MIFLKSLLQCLPNMAFRLWPNFCKKFPEIGSKCGRMMRWGVVMEDLDFLLSLDVLCVKIQVAK